MTLGLRCGDCGRMSFPHTQPVWHLPDCKQEVGERPEPLETLGELWSYTEQLGRCRASGLSRFAIIVLLEKQQVLVLGHYEVLDGVTPTIGMKVELINDRQPHKWCVPRWRRLEP
jgi:uncharacterized OB-fold protein